MSDEICFQPKILFVNSDMTSRGGIASVIQTLYEENVSQNAPIGLSLLKTSHYMDKSKISELVLFVEAFFRCLYMLLFKNIDIVHIHSSAGISFYRKCIFFFLSKSFRKKTIFHLHSSRFYEFFLTNNFLKNSLIKFVFNHADAVLVLCQDWKDKLRIKYPEAKVVTIYNPIQVESYNRKRPTNIKHDRLKVLFLAFLIPSKGVEDILEVAKKLKMEHVRNIEITIAGKGQLEDRILQDIKEYQLSEILKFRGWVDGQEKKNLLANSDVFFLPSYNEGMPISILEAMCNSLAIVSTPIAGIPDLVKEGVNGYLVEPGDIDVFCKILSMMSVENNMTFAMGQESYKLVQKFNSKEILEQLVCIYKRLIFVQ